MIPSDPKRYYSRFLNGHKGILHFSAHSHHFWPDVTREAQIEYWDDCAKTSDNKWDKVFSEVIPKAQNHIAKILNLKNSNQIVFAPNTHELTSRLLSLFVGKPSLNILTTGSEFHSWRRQILRLSELPTVSIDSIDTTDKELLLKTLKEKLQNKPDIFFISQVFFDSGIALTVEELSELKKASHPDTLMVVDGYHAFAALPVDLSSLEGKIFYLGGGYKYAQAGEGVGFMVVPQGNWRPANTGWFADYGDLTKPAGAMVGYAQDGLAFMGATQDPSGLYRFNATWDLFRDQGLTVEAIHQFIKQLQFKFIQDLSPNFLQKWGLKALFHKDLIHHGHFLTFQAKDENGAIELEFALKSEQVHIDRRGPRLRFGFGLYQDLNDVQTLCKKINKMT